MTIRLTHLRIQYNIDTLGLIHTRNMSEPRLRDPSDPLYDATDKWNEYKVDLHCNEKHSPDEWDPTTEGKLSDPQERHRDKVLDEYCDTHPGSPMCKVFDE